MQLRTVLFFSVILGAGHGLEADSTTAGSSWKPVPLLSDAPNPRTDRRDLRSPTFCKRLQRTSCPGGSRFPGGGGFEPPLTADLPHVRVSVHIDEIANVALSGGGIDGLGDFIGWKTGSTLPPDDQAPVGWVGWTLPVPGGTTTLAPPHDGPIFEAIVLNGCGAFPVFPIDHDVRMGTVSDADKFASVQFSDNSTLDDTGFYNMHYDVVATDNMTDTASRITVKGRVNVVCTGSPDL